MAPKLYMLERSAPVRSVLITAAAVGLDLEKEIVDIFSGDHMKAEYVKLNPQHTIPTLVDGDYVLWESHAIVPYLVSKYGKDDSLYPRDLQKRGTIDNRLHIDNTVTFKVLEQFGRALFFDGKKSFPQQLLKDADDAYALLNTCLEKSNFAAGDKVSVADFCWITTITTLNVYVPIDEGKWHHLAAWIDRIKKLPYYAANEPGLREYEILVKKMLNQSFHASIL